MIQVTFKVKVPVLIDQEADLFVARIPVLDIASQGDSESSARDNLVEAMQLWIESCFERGELDAALKECGFVAGNQGQLFDDDGDDGDFIDVPLNLLAAANGPQAHAG